MASGTKRKYYMLGGKGGVGKTSCAASLAVKFANHGHPTIVVSTDPAHSLSDSFDQVLIQIVTTLPSSSIFSCVFYLGACKEILSTSELLPVPKRIFFFF